MRTADAPAESASAAPEGGRCGYCLEPIDHEANVRFGAVAYCPRCKPYALQLLKEGAPLPGYLPYAGFWIRAGARTLDGLLQQALGALINAPILYLLADAAAAETPRMLLQSCAVPLLQLTAGAIYEIGFVSYYQATPGKMLLGLKIVTPDGDRLTKARAAGRYFALFLSQLSVGIGYLLAAFDEQKRALHDHVCSTRVVRVP